MTQDVVAQGQPQHPQPALPEQPVRMMPHGAMGPGSQSQAAHLLQLGAMAGARGVDAAMVTKFHGRVQDLAVNVTLAASKELLELVDGVVQARLNEVGAAINGLHRTTLMPQPLPQGTLDRLLNRPLVAYVDPSVPQPAHVSLDAVQQIIAAAIARARYNG